MSCRQPKKESGGPLSLWERVRVRGCTNSSSSRSNSPSPRLSQRERRRAAEGREAWRSNMQNEPNGGLGKRVATDGRDCRRRKTNARRCCLSAAAQNEPTAAAEGVHETGHTAGGASAPSRARRAPTN